MLLEAESRLKVASSRLSFVIQHLESSVSPAVSDNGRIRQQKEQDGPRLSSAVPGISGTLTPIALTAIRRWETLTCF